jgi:type II secretory pathway component GspD/PulD (secretin)
VIEISLAEVSRSRAHQLGLQIPTEFNLETSKRWAKQLTAQFGGQGGFARVLAQPQLRTIPGERARFQSGGEVPITTVSVEKINTTFKPYGLIVDITPSATPRRSSQVELQFSVELSEPQWKAKVDGPPSFSMRKLDSRFRVPTAEWVLLTSMQESRLGRQNSGVFGLKDIPGLGSLFGLENLFGEDAELWFALRASWSEIDVGTWSASSSR